MSQDKDAKADVAHIEATHRTLSHQSFDVEHKGEIKETKVADDVAGAYIDPTMVLTPEEDKRVKRKIWKQATSAGCLFESQGQRGRRFRATLIYSLVPVMCIAYITQSLDKGTLSASAIMGWQTDVKAVGQDYALTSTMLWIGIIVGEPIVNQCVRKFPVAKILGGSMVLWSALVFGIAFSMSIPPVFAVRFLLGFFESSFQPCLITITVQYFRTEEQTLLVTMWQCMFGVAGVISNILAYGFYHVQGAAIKSWQIFNVTIAIISLIATAIVLFYLPDTPTKARWATEQDKKAIIERVRVNDQGIKSKTFKKEQAIEAFTDPLTWLLFGMMFTQSLVVGGLNTFNSILINSAFGFDVLTSLLVSIPLSVFQVMLYFLAAWIGTRFKQTVFTMIGFTTVNIAGTIVLITVAPGPNTRGGLLVAFYLMQCFQSVNPSMNVSLSRNVAGATKKSIVYALFFVAWAGGNAIAPQLFQAVWKPRYTQSLYIHLGLYAFFIADVLCMRFLLARRNKQRDAALAGRENLHSKAFDDLTDLQNPDFRYSY